MNSLFAQAPPAAPASPNPLAAEAVTTTLAGAVDLVLPEVALLGVACLLFLLAVAGRRGRPALAAGVAFLGLAGAAAVAYFVPETPVPATLLTVAPIAPGGAAEFIRWAALGAGALCLLVAMKEAAADHAAEYYACLLVIVAGTSLAARANDLVSLYLALEMMSIPTYVLLYLPSQSKPAQEAAAKYFLLSILSTAVMLFGFSYLYGVTGTTNLTAMSLNLATLHAAGGSPLATLAAVLVAAGLGFRITAVPFHFYAPDVYQGGPTGVITQLAVMPKIAGFVALGRVFGLLGLNVGDSPFPAASQVPLLLWVLAAVSMTVGNVFALLQDNVKRVFAYSGVAHAGYMLLGLVAATAAGAKDAGPAGYYTGADAVLFYLVAYVLMTVGAFAVIAYLHSPDRPAETVDDFAGVGQAHPFAAALLAVALLSLIGMPLFAGFGGKLMIFVAAFQSPPAAGLGNLYRVLTVVAAVNAAIGAVYYLRLLGVMYLRSPLRPPERATGTGPLVAAALCAVATLAIGVYPKPLADEARKAAAGPAKPAAAAVVAAK